MTDKEIVERAKKAEKRTCFGELVRSPISKGVNSAFGIGFIEGMVEYRNSLQEEPVSKVWHDVATKAIEGRILWHSIYNDTWMVMFADQINWNVCDKWAYIDKLLKL